MTINVRVYCESCHREGQLRFLQRLTKEEIERYGKCPNCDVVGKLKFLSSK